MTAASIEPERQSASAPSTPAHSGVRPEIQALRALAVGLVVIYHLWPTRLTGGYIGVDVFFVISGYLITAHLRREVLDRGGVLLGRFWARRVRRLLPASFAVLILTLVATLVVVPQTYWQQFMREIGASALYIQNWALAADSVDYLAADNVPSPVQHFWSLSVEEQFYLLWPLLIVGAIGLATLTRSSARMAWVAAVLVTIIVASFVYSVAMTASDPGIAYFSTPVRAWEFAAGGALSLVPATAFSRAGHRVALSWAGLALIVFAGATYDSATPFPGWTAVLPVLGTLAVIYAGHTDSPWGTWRLYTNRPVRWLGDASYSIYLWHWPLIVLVPFALGHERTRLWTFMILLGTLVLSSLTKTHIEDRFRRPRGSRPRDLARDFSAMALAMALVVVVVILAMRASSAPPDQLDVGRPDGLSQDVCFGAEAVDPAADCGVDDDRPLVPDPGLAEQDRSDAYTGDCRTGTEDPTVRRCVFGEDDSEVRVALVGDSHTAQWLPAVQQIGADQGWSIDLYFKAACPFTAAAAAWDDTRARESCAQWNTDVVPVLLEESYDAIITSSASDYEWEAQDVQDHVVGGFVATWQELVDAGVEIIVIADTPRVPRNQLDCLEDNPDDTAQCGAERTAAFDFPHVLEPAAREVPEAVFLDMSDRLCSPTWCPAEIGRVVAYRDGSSHMTATLARSFAPQMLTMLTEQRPESALFEPQRAGS